MAKAKAKTKAKPKAKAKTGAKREKFTGQNDWTGAQNQYWNSWFKTARETLDHQMKSMAGGSNPWAAFFKTWQDTMGKTGVSGAGEWQKMFAQGGQWYFDCLKSCQPGGAFDGQCEKSVEQWLNQLRGFFHGLEGMDKGAGGFDFSAMNKTYADYAAKMQELYGMTNPFSAFFAHAHKGLHSASAGMDPFGMFAATPAMGYTREKQEALRDLFAAWADYERKLAHYNAAMAEVGLKAIDKFQKYLHNPPAGAEPLSSIKAVFAKWVDVAEEVFADYAMGEDYTRHYGEVVNALMAYRGKFNRQLDEMVDSFGLPTRQEVDSLHKRMQAMRQENRALREEIEKLWERVDRN